MRLNKYFLFFILLLIPFALATTTVDTTADSYPLGTDATVTGTCTTEGGVGLRALLNGENIWFDQATTINKAYSTAFRPSQKGTYTVYAACEGETAVSTTFCVGTAAECGTITPAADPTPPPTSPGGGGGCISQWKYGDWSHCNSSLQQSRTATDLRNCYYNKPLKKNIERACDACEEDWYCSLWSECYYGQQERSCADEHECGTTKKRPILAKNCVTPSSSLPAQVSQTLAPPNKPFIPPISYWSDLWEDYGTYIIIGVVGLLLLILIIFLIIHYSGRITKVYNHAKLKMWVNKERKAGTSEEDIKDILEEKTGWDDDEAMAFLSKPAHNKKFLITDKVKGEEK